MRKLLFICIFLLSASACTTTANEDFSIFLSRFSEEKTFAKSRTIYPLKVLTWEYGIDENGKDESAPILSYISKQEDEKYLNSLSSYMKENGLKSKIESLTPDAAVVHVFKEDTDWSMTYHFSRKGRSWYLIEFQNQSL